MSKFRNEKTKSNNDEYNNLEALQNISKILYFLLYKISISFFKYCRAKEAPKGMFGERRFQHNFILLLAVLDIVFKLSIYGH